MANPANFCSVGHGALGVHVALGVIIVPSQPEVAVYVLVFIGVTAAQKRLWSQTQLLKTAFSLVLAWDNLKQYISVFVSLSTEPNIDVNELLEGLSKKCWLYLRCTMLRQISKVTKKLRMCSDLPQSVWFVALSPDR